MSKGNREFDIEEWLIDFAVRMVRTAETWQRQKSTTTTRKKTS